LRFKLNIPEIREKPLITMRTYNSYTDEISPEELYEGLVGYGIFAEKIPNFLSSKMFLDYTKTLVFPLKLRPKDYIRFSSMRNINVPRSMAIPEPFAFANQCHALSENWANIQEHFREKTRNDRYKISRIHLRKLFNKPPLFEMNYKNFEKDGAPEQDILIKSKYIAEADISNCFPSIYSHAISWALVGKQTAKKYKTDQSQWYNQLDHHIMNVKYGETSGLLIGPHSSNLIAEIILVSIDNELVKKGFKYIRNIDDYQCYAETHEQAEKFLVSLSDELAKFELSLNHKKSKICPLPKANVRNWVTKLNHFYFTNTYNIGEKLGLRVKELKGFLDFATEIMLENNNDAAVLNYAIKTLSDKYLGVNAKDYFFKQIHHLVLLYPYLTSILEEKVFKPHSTPKWVIKNIAKDLFHLGINKRLFDACSYAVFWALKYDFELEIDNLKNLAIDSNDCIFLLISYQYHKATQKKGYLKEYRDHAVNLKKLDFDRYWLYVYEVLSWSDLTDNYKLMKKQGVTFLKDLLS